MIIINRPALFNKEIQRNHVISIQKVIIRMLWTIIYNVLKINQHWSKTPAKQSYFNILTHYHWLYMIILLLKGSSLLYRYQQFSGHDNIRRNCQPFPFLISSKGLNIIHLKLIWGPFRVKKPAIRITHTKTIWNCQYFTLVIVSVTP